MRVLVVSNMLPDAAHPERGRFVRDQVQALRRLSSRAERAEGPHTASSGRSLQDEPLSLSQEQLAETPEPVDVELFEFAPGLRSLLGAARELRRRYRGQRLDVVHAHFGLSAYPALAVRARARGLTLHGTDLAHPRTRLLTRAILPTIDLLAVASEQLLDSLPTRRARARAKVLPCGVDMERFERRPRARARERLELDPTGPYLLFPADPARSEKRHDRALALADALGARLLTLGGVPPERVPLYVNAADIVIIPSDREGFGLAALEALACDVPVLATPVGIHRQALDGIAGCLCAPFQLDSWRAAAESHLHREDRAVGEQPAPGSEHRASNEHEPGGEHVPGEECGRVAGRARARRFSSERAARALAEAWGSLSGAGG